MNLRKEKPLSVFHPLDEVLYVPTHANGDKTHQAVEKGYVSSITEKYIFVKFEKQILRLGWNGTTSQGCRREDLKKTNNIVPEHLIPL